MEVRANQLLPGAVAPLSGFFTTLCVHACSHISSSARKEWESRLNMLMSLMARFCEGHMCSDPLLSFQLCVQSAMLLVCEDIGTKMRLEKKATLYPFDFFFHLHLFHFLCLFEFIFFSYF